MTEGDSTYCTSLNNLLITCGGKSSQDWLKNLRMIRSEKEFSIENYLMLQGRSWGRPVYDHLEKLFICGGANFNRKALKHSEVLDFNKKKFK